MKAEADRDLVSLAVGSPSRRNEVARRLSVKGRRMRPTAPSVPLHALGVSRLLLDPGAFLDQRRCDPLPVVLTVDGLVKHVQRLDR